MKLSPRTNVTICCSFAFLVASFLFYTYLTRPAPGSIQLPDFDAGKEFDWNKEFYNLLTGYPIRVNRALANIERHWEPGFVAMLIEAANTTKNKNTIKGIVALLEKQTGQQLGHNFRAWYQWLWKQELPNYKKYASYKGWLYSNVDMRFVEYFDDDAPIEIRLDEVRWGGVRRDGIPPLKNPKMISADDSVYLEDSNIVFGIVINGDVRAYPKRILAWHEMFTDTVGGKSINGVYCTLCGSMIVYETEIGGQNHELGTSGFLYRSNKLMYDHKTKSLWSTLSGKPVIGPLVGQGIELKPHHVVTTTWGKWRKLHPDTKVLSFETGYKRNYAEGEAYKDYFANDDLMFGVPESDSRLKNKDEILAVRVGEMETEQLAIAVDYLSSNRIHQDQVGDVKFVVITDESGANRVYESQNEEFVALTEDGDPVHENGEVWRLSERMLKGPNGQTLNRLPAHRAFWFGWHAVYPGTRLIK